MESVISKGSTVDEAVRLGLEKLQATRDQVSIEVIQTEKKRMLGLLSQEAVVKITKIRAPQPEQPKAKVWLKDGQLYYECTPTERPTITKGKGVRLFCNGKEVHDTITIEEGDQLEVRVEEEEKTEAAWNITVDSRKMQAVLMVEPAVRKYYVLNDIAPAKHIKLQAELRTEAEHTISYEEVVSRLEQLGIVYGVNEEKIKEALQASERVSVVIAEGQLPQDGKDGWAELKAGMNQSKKPRVRQDGTVDYREMEIISSVQEGEVIAIIHPPKPGLPGRRVTGEWIAVRDVFPIHVQLGKGVMISSDGTSLVATQSGRPQIVKKGRTVIVSVIPKLVHQGDVDLSTGNIRFKGDIEITGNVQDGMEVEAVGSVVIFQNVNRAKIQAQQSIFIHHNLIGGTIVSGEQKIVIAELSTLLHEIRQQLEKMIFALQQLIMFSKLQEKDIYIVAKRLLETKFQSLIEAVKKYESICQAKKEVLSEPWLELSNRFQSCFIAEKPNHFHCLESFAELLRQINEFMNQYEQTETDSVELSYALNSVIHCSGDVIVSGKGCYNCNIYAGGKLVIDGILRGGEVYAQKGIYVKEAGSSFGIKTTLAVPKGETIQIDHAWEGTVIQIGKKVHTFLETRKGIRARWDEEKDAIELH
ncbi:FapA family protein [Anoxybacteroides amylolyticum]|uniref:Jag family protein n=1 Tax=Anoxybacteroides amylolyticum TaxID=294699 RepID=A0A160F4G2_9BACL|nr:FapA family protein [Anoxybacillus amylolyticus]ANB61256.1 jag family protein [Anoxybacillus amylolyticus]